MKHLPFYIPFVFALTVITALVAGFWASNYSKVFLALSMAWVLTQGMVGLTGFYTVTSTTPPRFPLLVIAPIIAIVLTLVTNRGRRFIASLDLKKLTLLHTVRIPVELVLFWLAAHKAVPELMTFKGSNFDILSGLTAPFVYYFGFVQQKLGKGFLIAWNVICLGLLVNVVADAVLSLPTPFQRLAFDQPNIAVGYFPFVLLPAFIVPLVLFSHLASLRILTATSKGSR